MRVLAALILCSVVAYVSAFPSPLPSCKVKGQQIIDRINTLQTQIEPLLANLGLDLDDIQTAIDYVAGTNTATVGELKSKLQDLIKELDKLKVVMKIKARNVLNLAKGEVRSRGVTNPEIVEILAMFQIFDKDVLYIHKTLGVLCGLMNQPKGMDMEMVASEMDDMDMNEEEVAMMIGMVVDNMVNRADVMRFINSGLCYLQIIGYRQFLATVTKTDPDLVMIAYNVRELIKRCKVIASTANELLNAIPTSIRTLLQAEKVCVQNVAYNERLIVDQFRDSGLHMAFTWIESNKLEKHDLRHLRYWQPAVINQNSITLQNTHYKEFLTQLANKDFVYTGTTNTPWTIEATGNNIYLKSSVRNEYAYVDEAKFCPERRRVKTKAAKGPSSIWNVIPC